MSRILWHSAAPWVPTGYGVQTALFATRLRDAGHDVAISSTWGLGGAALDWNGITVYPCDQKWGNATLPEFANRHNADLVIGLLDAWVLNPDVMRHLPMAIWVPVDHAPVPPKVAAFFHSSGARPVAMSKFGREMLENDGLDPLYVPHGVQTDLYTPENRDRVREVTRTTDRFVVGMVANNAGGMPPAGGVPRKAFPQAFLAFRELYDKHPDALLYLHTEMTGRPGIDHGLDLSKLLNRFEIPPEAIKITSPLEMEVGISPSGMAGLYSSFDVLLNPSFGEGFGVPIMEAQACGCPVIVSDWTSMPELVGAGWKVTGEPWYDPSHDAFFLAPNVHSIIAALEQAYENRANQQLRAEAREFALTYDADKVFAEHWLPALDALTKPREVAPLPNRQMRRATRKAKAA